MPSILNASSESKQQQQQSSSSLPTTTTLSTGTKIDCAKECPCGGPTIPVPDQWLEVMVTGGFKVWHIIFIIIALIVTMVVVYCCFHRCRIPRTKQEIEADLMRTNMTNKFRDYLQELPNEQTTFVEALKKVKEMEEKLEQDDALYSRDAGARKRMGWLKLKGKDKAGPEAAATSESPQGENPADQEQVAPEDSSKQAEVQLPELQTGVQLETSPVADAGGLLVPPRPDADGKVDDEKQAQAEHKSRQSRPRKKPKPNLSRTKNARKDSSALELPPEPTVARNESKPEANGSSSKLGPPPADGPTIATNGHQHAKQRHGNRTRSASKNATPSRSKDPAKQVPEKDNNR